MGKNLKSLKLHDEWIISEVMKRAKAQNIPAYAVVEELLNMVLVSPEVENLNVVNPEEHGVEYTYIHIPLESIYLQEMIDTFLVNYNTVGIQKTPDCYILRLERRENK
jgi:hypothetical protein